MAVCYTRIESPVGPLVLAASDAGLHHVLFANSKRTKLDPEWREGADLFKEVIQQLRAYFASELETFDVPSHPRVPSSNRMYGVNSAEFRTGKRSRMENWQSGWAIQKPRAL